VRVDDEAVTVTFYVEPNPSDVSCPGNDEVAWEVELPEPLGPRELVDGQCSRGGEASGSTFCRPDGVRYPAAAGAPAVALTVAEEVDRSTMVVPNRSRG